MNSIQIRLARRAALVIAILVVAFILSSVVLAFPVSARSGPVGPQSPSSLMVNFGALAPAKAVVDKNPAWSGYGDVGANGSVHAVYASFTIPKSATCNSSSPYGQETFILAAMDDLVTSSDFEYAGALAYCPVGASSPSYYPSDTTNFYYLGWFPNPGDNISASIKVVHSSFIYNVTDVTTHESLVNTSSTVNASLNSAEVLTDTASGGTCVVECPLVNFGTLSFGQGYTSINKTCYATIAGKTEPIGGFGTVTTLYKGITTNVAGTVVDAATSALTSKATSFEITFKHAGP